MNSRLLILTLADSALAADPGRRRDALSVAEYERERAAKDALRVNLGDSGAKSCQFIFRFGRELIPSIEAKRASYAAAAAARGCVDPAAVEALVNIHCLLIMIKFAVRSAKANRGYSKLDPLMGWLAENTAWSVDQVKSAFWRGVLDFSSRGDLSFAALLDSRLVRNCLIPLEMARGAFSSCMSPDCCAAVSADDPLHTRCQEHMGDFSCSDWEEVCLLLLIEIPGDE